MAGLHVSTLQIAVRIGVVACVAVASLLGAGKLDNALAVFDYRADTNAAATSNERTYPEIEFLPGWARVMEDARLWMPENAAYRVIDGPNAPSLRSGRCTCKNPCRSCLFLFCPLTPTSH